MRTAAVLPVKSFGNAKQRLGESVADPLRSALARAMVADVLLALSQTTSIERTIVVTRELGVADAARGQGAIVLEEETESGQSAAVSLGVRRAIEEGFGRVLCVPGDCPALDPDELEGLLRAPARPAPTASAGGPAPEVVILPDRHGSGTNGLLLSPPDAIAPAFGPGSCERHHALALAAGVVCRVERLPSLLLDIDTGADLAVLGKRLAGHAAPASHTRSVLGQPERRHILSIPTSA
jgi:2-phospho-L-lactate guanylyltransferase